MEKIRVAINGFGRIGRITLRELIKNPHINVIGVNDLTSPESLAYLLKYDSNHGRFPLPVSVNGSKLKIGNIEEIEIFSERDPSSLPWGELGIDVVLESTGIFRKRDQLMKHILAGAKKVILSAPARGPGVKTIVLGVNDHLITAEDDIISNASCTTNCLSPIAKILLDEYDIERGYMTTVHAMTSDQRILDAPHSDLRRGRSASSSIIPTSTGAAVAVGLILPELEGKIDGIAMRVPVETGSLIDCVFELKARPSSNEINMLVKNASENHMKGIIQYTEDPIVSADIVSSPYSCIFDASLTKVHGNLVKIIGWYDNEYGYSARSAEMIAKVGKMIAVEAGN